MKTFLLIILSKSSKYFNTSENPGDWTNCYTWVCHGLLTKCVFIFARDFCLRKEQIYSKLSPQLLSLQELDNFEPYPVEILSGKLYMGNFKQACDQQIQKDLKIKAQVNISEQPATL